MVLINGQPQTSLDIRDRATQYGDGCFTTARVLSGTIRFFQDHLIRLREGTAVLGIDSTDWDSLEKEALFLSAGQEEAVLKVVLTRGRGGRGYSPANCATTTRILSLSPVPSHYASWRTDGICLAESPVRLAQQPLLAGIKHLNRLEQVLIRRHFDACGASEGLVSDMVGNLVSACSANVFWRQGRKIFTPRVDLAGVNGTMRQHIIRCLAQQGHACEQVSVPVSVLEQADEVFICNALMPVVPVHQFRTQRYVSRDLYDSLLPYCE